MSMGLKWSRVERTGNTIQGTMVYLERGPVQPLITDAHLQRSRE